MSNKLKPAPKGDTRKRSHLPHRLFVGLFKALPLGNGAMRDDGGDSGLVSACER